MERSVRLALVLFGSALLSLATAAPSGAAPAPAPVTEVVSKTVRFQDIDINTSAGAAVLYGRIVSAARAVCREAASSAVRECRVGAVDAAVAGVDSTLLTAIHRSVTLAAEGVVSR